MPQLALDCYDSIIYDAGSTYTRNLLIKDGLDWKWHGVLHEYVASPKQKPSEVLKASKKFPTGKGPALQTR